MQELDQAFLDKIRSIGSEELKPSLVTAEPTELIETVDAAPEVGSVGSPALVSHVTLQNIFRHPDAHPIALDLLLIHKYGIEWMGWEGETLELHIPVDFKTTLSEVNLSKIQAVRTLHLVDSFWQRWEVFVWCTMSLNGIPPDFEVMQVPTVAQVLVAIDIANRIRKDVAWSQEVKHFIETVFWHDGVFYPLPPADFIELDVSHYPINPTELLAKWPAVKTSGHAPTDDTVTGEQLRRLLVVQHYLDESRDHLRQQLSLVSHAPS